MTKRPMVVAHVHVKAEQIRKIVSESGEIFGEPVDMTDIDEVIYAAYFAGWAEGVIDSAKIAPPLDGHWRQCPACGAVETPDYIIQRTDETVVNLKSQLAEARAEIAHLRAALELLATPERYDDDGWIKSPVGTMYPHSFARRALGVEATNP